MNKIHSSCTESAWFGTVSSRNNLPELDNNIEVDIAIVGGGITGITAALELTKSDKNITVAILEAYTVGSGTTGNSTGNLYIPTQPLYQNILANFDQQTVTTIAQSRKEAIDYIEDTVNENSLDCHFARRNWYLYTNQQENFKKLDTEISVLKNVNIDIDYTSEIDIPVPYKKAALLRNQARFHPLKYITALANIISKDNCQIFENSPVLSIEYKNNVHYLKTKNGTVKATKIIMATHTPKGINLVQFLESSYRSYVIAAKLKDEKYPQGHYWDLDEPNYVTSVHALHSKKLDSIMIAGDHHKTGQTHLNQHYYKIENYLRKHYEVDTIEYKWSAQHYQASDKIPFIGHTANNVYLATGFFADGLIYGTIAGRSIANLILKNQKSESVYNAKRFKLIASALPVLKESSNNFCQYLKDFPGNVDVKSLDKIKIGEGKTITIDGEKFAAYRDMGNKLHVVSAVCTHMKCIVNWNIEETTWDCPCHGSRFTIDGEVIEGPAYTKLKSLNTLE